MTFADRSAHGADHGEAQRIVDAYAEAGGDVIDTAVNYRDGASEPGQFPREIRRGTIGDRVEPPAEADLVVRSLLLGLHARLRAVQFVRVSARMPQARPGGRPRRRPDNAAAITVMVSPDRPGWARGPGAA
jgi:hypothetical protein